MTIDAKKIDEALGWMRGKTQFLNDEWQHRVETAIEAASAYAATLPREVKREYFEVLLADGCSFGLFPDEAKAQSWSASYPRSQVVRLTGKAILPRVKD